MEHTFKLLNLWGLHCGFVSFMVSRTVQAGWV
jgi:hypothetical protein